MWHYTKCTSEDRKEKLKQLADAFKKENDCLRYLSGVQSYISSAQTTLVLLQDLDANLMIEMDYVPINNYMFHVVCIKDNGIKEQGRPCRTVMQAVDEFWGWMEGGSRR